MIMWQWWQDQRAQYPHLCNAAELTAWIAVYITAALVLCWVVDGAFL